MDLGRLSAIQDEEAWKAAYEEEMAKLEESFQELTRLQYEMVTQKTESPRLAEIQRHHYELFTDPRFAKMLQTWEQKLGNPQWKRRLAVLESKAREEEIECHPDIASHKNALLSEILKKTITHNGVTYPFSSVQTHLMMNTDRGLRKDLFMETVKAGQELTSEFRELVRARNRLAREKGYEHYHQFVFEGMYGIKWESYREEGMQMMRKTEAVFREWNARFQDRFGWEELYYHDLLFAAFSYYDIPAEMFPGENIYGAMERTCAHFGISLSDTPIRVDMCDMPYGGLMNAISPLDIRVAVRKRDGFGGYKVALHEMGHALYEYFSAHQPPELFRFKNLIGHEAMAETFMTISTQREWLRDVIWADDALIRQIQESEHFFYLVLTKLYFYQSVLEHALYESPEADFQDLSDKWAQEVLGVRGSGASPAAEAIFLAYPVYTHSYLFADGIRDMLRHAFGVSGLYGNQRVFEELRKNFMQPSERLSWQEKVQKLCGEPFTFRYFTQYLARGSAFI